MPLKTLSVADEQDLLSRITLAADDSAKAAQQARSKRSGIGIKEGGNVTKPSKWKNIPDSQWGDYTNYRYPLHDKAHADNAASRWGDASNRKQYNAKEQAIIGGRIKRRQAHFGSSTASDTKETDTKKTILPDGTLALTDDQGIMTLSADGLHEPMDGTHSHSHAHDDGTGHSHDHIHHNDNTHDAHTHVVDDEDDDTAPDGDGDQDDWNEPSGPQMSEPAKPVPNQNIPAPSSAPTTPAPIPGALRSLTSEQETMLSTINTLGASLGFAPVNANGERADGYSLSSDVATGFQQSLGSLAVGLASAMEQIVQLSLGFQAKSGAPVDDYATFVRPLKKAVHDFVATDPAICAAIHLSVPPPSGEGFQSEPTDLNGRSLQQATREGSIVEDEAPPVGTPGPGSTLSVDTDAIVAGVTAQVQAAVAAQLNGAQNRINQLNTTITQLSNRGLGRPTTFAGRPALFVGIDEEETPPVDVSDVTTSDELKRRMPTMKRLDGMKCRQWSDGVGLGMRPDLMTHQMKYMSPSDISAYYDGGAVLVPVVLDGD